MPEPALEPSPVAAAPDVSAARQAVEALRLGVVPASCVADYTVAREQELAVWLERYVRRLEELCRSHPLQWSNFYDFWGDDQAAESAANHPPRERSAASADTIRA